MIDWLRVRDNIVNIFFVLTAAIFSVIALSGIVYYINANWFYDFPINNANLMKEYAHLMEYLLNPFSGELKFLYFPASRSGLLHFVDVKNLFLLNNIVFLVTLGLKKVFKIKLRFYAKDAAIIGILPVIIGIIAAMDFDQFFVMFHEVLFRNSDWMFDPVADPIINVLPEEFFEQLIFMFFIIFEIMVYIGYKKRAKELS